MSLPLHLSIHVALSLFAGFLIWKWRGNLILAFLGALVGGVLIDVDHLIDYFLAFGWHFRLSEFLHGQQFLVDNRIYVLFHGWEYVILLLFLAFVVVQKEYIRTVLFSLALGMLFHLMFDVSVNDGMTVRGYSIAYRAWNGFRIEHIVTPEHLERHMMEHEAVYGQ